MGKASESDLVLLLHRYDIKSRLLRNSFINSDINITTLVIEDEGFLPENVLSVYGYFLGWNDRKDLKKSPKYFNEIDIPELWKVVADRYKAEIYDYSRLKGTLTYNERDNTRLVNRAEWYDDNGNVRLIDCYNEYGELFSKICCDKNGKKVNRTYFRDNIEIIVENYITGHILLNYNGRRYVLKNKVALVKMCIEEMKLSTKKFVINSLHYPYNVIKDMDNGVQNILFWQESIKDEIPRKLKQVLQDSGNIKTYIQDKQAWDRLMQVEGKTEEIEKRGFVYNFLPLRKFKKKIYICTNSDRLVQVENLIKGLEEYTFIISARTSMSEKLTSLTVYPNVELYPKIDFDKEEELINDCSVYFDINSDSGISGIIERVFIHNMLIYGWKDTLHDERLISDRNVFESNQCGDLIAAVKRIKDDRTFLTMIEAQKDCAEIETADSFLCGIV